MLLWILWAGGVFPRSIVVDSELIRSSFGQLCLFIASSNGKVELGNRTLRKVMRAYFVRSNDIKRANHLQDFVSNINNQQQSASSPQISWIRENQPRPPGYIMPPSFRVTDQMGQPQ